MFIVPCYILCTYFLVDSNQTVRVDVDNALFDVIDKTQNPAVSICNPSPQFPRVCSLDL